MSLQISDADVWYERITKYIEQQDTRHGGTAYQLGYVQSMLAGILAGRDVEQTRNRILSALGEGDQ